MAATSALRAIARSLARRRSGRTAGQKHETEKAFCSAIGGPNRSLTPLVLLRRGRPAYRPIGTPFLTALTVCLALSPLLYRAITANGTARRRQNSGRLLPPLTAKKKAETVLVFVLRCSREKRRGRLLLDCGEGGVAEGGRHVI